MTKNRLRPQRTQSSNYFRDRLKQIFVFRTTRPHLVIQKLQSMLVAGLYQPSWLHSLLVGALLVGGVQSSAHNLEILPPPEGFALTNAAMTQDFESLNDTGVLSRPIDLQTDANQNRSIFVDKFNYSERLDSQSRKTEVGEQLRLDIGFRKDFSANTFLSVGVEVNPQEKALLPAGPSTTSVFEIRLNHKVDAFEFQVDLDLKTASSSEQGIALGTDSDSESTFIRYQLTPYFNLSFLPYNFDGEVGSQFNTWDVTRLHFIDGAPTSLSGIVTEGIHLETKTIPGIMATYIAFDGFSLSLGGGAASFLYPANADFNLLANNPTITQWERRKDVGYRAELNWEHEQHKLELAFVSHNQSQQTGSLLESATALNFEGQYGAWYIGTELVLAKAGQAPYSLGQGGQWFANGGAPFQPLYADFYGEPQDWFGKTGSAALLRLGHRFGKHLPYISVMHQSEYFIFREAESAHLLRNSEGTKSHGGLLRFEVGAVIKAGPILVVPEVEWRQANQPVFATSSDISRDPFNGTYNTTDYLLSINVSYGFSEAPFAKWLNTGSSI